MIFSGAADNTENVLNCIDSIKLFRPIKVHLLVGTNDVVSDYAGFQTRYPQIVSELESVGAEVLICLLLPRNTFNVTTANAWLSSTFSTYTIVDYFTLLKDGGTGISASYSDDGLHPNSTGAALMASYLETLL